MNVFVELRAGGWRCLGTVENVLAYMLNVSAYILRDLGSNPCVYTFFLFFARHKTTLSHYILVRISGHILLLLEYSYMVYIYMI